MTDHFPMLIPDATSDDGELEVKTPYDGSVIGRVAAADAGAIERAHANAFGLFGDRTRWLKPSQRIEILSKSADLMSQRAEELALEAAREGGKPLTDSKVEVARAIDGVKSCIEFLRTEGGDEIPMNLNAASEGRVAFTRREPIGVVVAISAFNHPLNLIVHQVGPAVAVGCPVIVKPAEDTPLSCFRFVQILREAGLPEGWCQALVTKDRKAAEALVVDPRVSFLSFIGSARVGWMLRSKLSPGTRCALEHGGAAPVIVAADADLDYTLPLLAKGGLYHAGQVCVSVQRVFVHESIVGELADRLADQVQQLRVGDPTDADTDVGPLIRPSETNRVEAWVNEAVEAGAKLLTGGKRISDSCYECTVLLDPPVEAKVSQLEIFGPVICLYSYTDIDQAIQQANFSTAGLSGLGIHEGYRYGDARLLAAKGLGGHDQRSQRLSCRLDAVRRLGRIGSGRGGIPHTMRDMQIEKMMVLKSARL